MGKPLQISRSVFGRNARTKQEQAIAAMISGHGGADVYAPQVHEPGLSEVEHLPVGGVAIHRLGTFQDLRGSLAVGELGKQLPFEPKRSFVVHDVPSRHVRGERAHRKIHQFLVCLTGELSLVVDDGTRRQEIRLHGPGIGVHVPPMVRGIQDRFSPEAMLLVLASEPYDSGEYIRDYEGYRRLVKAPG